MQIQKQEFQELANIISAAVIEALEKRGLLGKTESSANSKTEKTAYQKTEQLLYNYNGFKRIIREREQEIEELRLHGVPKNNSVREYVDRGGMPQGIVLEEESVDNAIANVQRSVQSTVQVIALIDKCMAAMSKDYYYKILEMRYFEGRTLEDVAIEFKCTQQNISYHRSRLVKELSLRLFPDQVIEEMMQ